MAGNDDVNDMNDDVGGNPQPVSPQPWAAELAVIRGRMCRSLGHGVAYWWARSRADPDDLRRLVGALLGGNADATAGTEPWDAPGLFAAATGRAGTAAEVGAFFDPIFRCRDGAKWAADPDVAAGFAAGVLEAWQTPTDVFGPAA
jgi:hypothetical protein